MHSKVWGEITYLLSNFNGSTVTVWEWIRKFIPHLIMDATHHPWFMLIHFNERVPRYPLHSYRGYFLGTDQSCGCPRVTGRTVYPKKYAHGFVVLCFVVVMQSFIMNSHEVFIHIQQGCIAGTGAIVRLPQCQWSKPDGYGKISQCITTTKHSKAKTVCIFLEIYCTLMNMLNISRAFTTNFWYN